MTIKQINEMRTKQRKLLSDKQHTHDEFTQANYRIMEDLDLQEKLAHDELVKRIRKHFKGVIPVIEISIKSISIMYQFKPTPSHMGMESSILFYKYGVMVFSEITRKLAEKIIFEYEEVYGQVTE